MVRSATFLKPRSVVSPITVLWDRDQKGETIHELVTASIIEKDEELRGILGSYPVENIVTLLGKGVDRRDPEASGLRAP